MSSPVGASALPSSLGEVVVACQPDLLERAPLGLDRQRLPGEDVVAEVDDRLVHAAA